VFAGFLILPFSAFVAFVTLVGAEVAGRRGPRLVWPFACSSLFALVALFPLPAASEIGMWLFMASMVVLWSAGLGTVIGGLLARAAIAGVRRIRSR